MVIAASQSETPNTMTAPISGKTAAGIFFIDEVYQSQGHRTYFIRKSRYKFFSQIRATELNRLFGDCNTNN